MPRSEEVKPWATSRASDKEPYARKNLYFIGESQEEVYDYCIWRANVRGYRTLDGEQARSTSEMINDVMRRAYARDMLDQELADDFTAWRRAQYEAYGLPPERAALQLYAPDTNAATSSSEEGSRFEAYLRKRSMIDKKTRIALWRAQGGKCAVCGLARHLQAYVRPNAHILPVTDRSNPDRDRSNVVLLCRACNERFRTTIAAPDHSVT